MFGNNNYRGNSYVTNFNERRSKWIKRVTVVIAIVAVGCGVGVGIGRMSCQATTNSEEIIRNKTDYDRTDVLGNMDTRNSSTVNVIAIVTANTASRKNQTQQRKKDASTGILELPENAHSKHPLSLLLEMKIVKPPTSSYMNYTECIDQSSNGTERTRGWRANMFVNGEMAGSGNYSMENFAGRRFVGYGRDKVNARKAAAESLLMAIYPHSLTYPEVDLTPFLPFCKD